jgi:hypothetical protein
MRSESLHVLPSSSVHAGYRILMFLDPASIGSQRSSPPSTITTDLLTAPPPAIASCTPCSFTTES